MSHLIVTYGYLAVALLVGAESVGIPVPGETALILAAGYAGHTHQLSGWIIFAAAAAAAILGDNAGFWIGGTGGYRLLRRYGHYVGIDETKLKIGRYIFDRHGGKLLKAPRRCPAPGPSRVRIILPHRPIQTPGLPGPGVCIGHHSSPEPAIATPGSSAGHGQGGVDGVRNRR